MNAITPLSGWLQTHVSAVMQAVADVYSITVADLVGEVRSRRTSNARHVAMWIVRKTTNMALEEIAAAFGRTNHATIAHAIRKVEADHVLADEAASLMKPFERKN